MSLQPTRLQRPAAAPFVARSGGGLLPMQSGAARRWSDSLPEGLRALHRLAAQLSSLGKPLDRNLRVVVTVPTTSLAAGVVAIAGVQRRDEKCIDCSHLQLQTGDRATGWASGEFVDATIGSLNGEQVMFAGITSPRDRASIHRLPDGFPTRPKSRFSDDLKADIARGLRCPEASAGQKQSAASAHPVVVVGDPSAYEADLAGLVEHFPASALRSSGDFGRSLEDWYRHPVIAVGRLPRAHEVPWASGLVPRLVVTAGAAAAVARPHDLWQDCPVLTILSRRSPSATQRASALSSSGGRVSSAHGATLRLDLLARYGIEAFARVGEEAPAEDEDLW